MTTHKDRPHAANCRACLFPISGGGFTEAPCNCAEGTRWHGNGARPEDAIAIQGIATFFARLQPAAAWVSSDGAAAVTNGQRARMHDTVARSYDRPTYASPVTPAAPPAVSHEVIVGDDGKMFVPRELADLYAKPAAQTVAVPDEVMRALDRMCTPLDPSLLKGATAEADAHSMKVIRDYVLSTQQQGGA